MSKWQIVPKEDGTSFLAKGEDGLFCLLSKIIVSPRERNLLFDTEQKADAFIEANFELGGYSSEEIYGF